MYQNSFTAGNKKLIIFFILFSLCVITAAFYIYTKYMHDIEQDIKNELKSVADLKMDGVTSWRNERIKNLEILQNEGFGERIRKTIVYPENAEIQKEMQDWLNKFIDNYHYARVCLHDLDGKEFMKTSDDEVQLPQPLKDYYKRLFEDGEIVYEDFYYDSKLGRNSITMLAGMLDFKHGKKPLAYLITIIDPDDFINPFLSSWPVPKETAEVFLVRKEGNDVVFLNKTRKNPDSALKLKLSLDRTDMPAVAAVNGHTGFFEGTDYNGDEVISYTQPVHDTGWYIISKIDRSEAFKHKKEVSGVIFGFTLMGIILSGILLVSISRSKQLEHMKEIEEKSKIIEQNEERYRGMFENNHAIMFMIDPDTSKIIDANPAAVKTYGYSRQELLNMKISDINILSAYEVGQKIEQARKEKLNYFILKHKRKNGEVIDVESFSGPIKYGDKTYLFSIVHDITAKLKSENELKLTKELLLAAIEGTQAGLWDWNIKTGNTVFNDKWAEMIGYTLKELEPLGIGTWEKLTHPEDLRKAKESLAAHFKGSADIYECEIRMKHKNGSWVWILDKGKVFERNADGEPIRMIGTHTNINVLKHAMEELEMIKENLENIVYERTEELEEKTKQLEEQNEKLKHFNQLFVDREFRVKELKDKVAELEIMLKDKEK
jgi:PAS domain S-box-containing protein